MNIWEDSNNSVERKKINLDFQGAKYYFWQDEMETMNKFQVKPCVGHSVESEKEELSCEEILDKYDSYLTKEQKELISEQQEFENILKSKLVEKYK
jgi:iron uptake system EfeUOB component EfeO/EfeM